MLLKEVIIPLLTLLLISLKINSVKGQLIHKFGNGNASWENATSACTLATPKISFVDGKMVAMFEGGEISMTEGEDAWLGFVLDSVILQNVGCMTYDVEKEPRLSTYFDTGADPGFCYTACREKGYFGIMKTKCFCFNTWPALPTENMFETTCKQPCSKLNDEAVCGGNNVVSLYTRAALSASEVEEFPKPTDSGNCILYDRNAGEFYSTKCSLSYRIGCQNQTGSDEMVNIRSTTVSWLKMTEYCSSYNFYPYTYEGVLKDSGEYNQVWTGMIKARKMYKKLQGSSQPLAVAYVRVEGGEYKVRFANPAAVKRFICQEGVQTTTPADPVTQMVPETTNVNTQAITDVEEANLLPLFIVIPIVLVVVAIVVILLIIRWRRKIRSNELKSRNLMRSPQGKAGKKRKPSKERENADDTVRMVDVMDESTPVSERKPTKRNSYFSTQENLIATISLDNAVFENEAFTSVANEQPKTPTSFKNGTEKQPKDKDSKKVKSHRNNKDKEQDKANPADGIRDEPHDNNEYARINKKRKESEPKKEDNAQMYDKLGAGKKGKDDTKKGTNYDQVVFGEDDSDMYDKTSKPMTVPQRDYLYDGLHRF